MFQSLRTFDKVPAVVGSTEGLAKSLGLSGDSLFERLGQTDVNAVVVRLVRFAKGEAMRRDLVKFHDRIKPALDTMQG